MRAIDADDFIERLSHVPMVQEAIRKSMDKMPTIEPKWKKGKWIPQDHNKSNGSATTLVYYFPKCSECGHSGDSAFTFCPWCGADMRGEQNETD